MVERLPTLESLLPEPNSTACLGFYNSAVCHFASFLKTIFIWLHWILVEAHGFSCPVACGILVLPPGIEPLPPCITRWILNHWTSREVHVTLHPALPVSSDHHSGDVIVSLAHTRGG